MFSFVCERRTRDAKSFWAILQVFFLEKNISFWDKIIFLFSGEQNIPATAKKGSSNHLSRLGKNSNNTSVWSFQVPIRCEENTETVLQIVPQNTRITKNKRVVSPFIFHIDSDEMLRISILFIDWFCCLFFFQKKWDLIKTRMLKHTQVLKNMGVRYGPWGINT